MRARLVVVLPIHWTASRDNAGSANLSCPSGVSMIPMHIARARARGDDAAERLPSNPRATAATTATLARVGASGSLLLAFARSTLNNSKRRRRVTRKPPALSLPASQQPNRAKTLLLARDRRPFGFAPYHPSLPAARPPFPPSPAQRPLVLLPSLLPSIFVGPCVLQPIPLPHHLVRVKASTTPDITFTRIVQSRGSWSPAQTRSPPLLPPHPSLF